MGYECVMCMETLETPAPTSLVAIPQYCIDTDVPGPSGSQNVNKALVEDTHEYLSSICATTCGHIFHKACLNRWFHQKMKRECPSCRKLLTPGKIFHIYPPSLSEDFVSQKLGQFKEIEDGNLAQCGCQSDECNQLYHIYKNLVSDHNKLLQRFADQSDENSLLVAQKASLEEECARLKKILHPGTTVESNEEQASSLTPHYMNVLESINIRHRPTSAPSPSPSSPSESAVTQVNGRIAPRRPRQNVLHATEVVTLSTSSSGGRLKAISSFLRAMNWTKRCPQPQQVGATTSESSRILIPQPSTSRPPVTSATSSPSSSTSSRILRTFFPSRSVEIPEDSPLPPATATSSCSANAVQSPERPRILISRLNEPVPSTSASARNNRSPSQHQQHIPKTTIVIKGNMKLQIVDMKSTGGCPRSLKQLRGNDATERLSYAIRTNLNSDFTQALQNCDAIAIAPSSFNRVKELTKTVARKSTAWSSSPASHQPIATSPTISYTPTSSSRAYQPARLSWPLTSPVVEKETARKSTSKPAQPLPRRKYVARSLAYSKDSSESEIEHRRQCTKLKRIRRPKKVQFKSGYEQGKKLSKSGPGHGKTKIRSNTTSESENEHSATTTQLSSNTSSSESEDFDSHNVPTIKMCGHVNTSY